MKASGFTLIELLVVIALVALLTALAAPSMTTFLGRRAVAAASDTLASDLRFARSEALKRSNYVTVCRSTDGATCAGGGGSWSDGWIVFTDGNGRGDGAVGGADAILRVQSRLTGVATLQNATAASTRGAFTYQPLGIGIAQNDTLVVTPQFNGTTANSQLICISSQARAMVRPIGCTTCAAGGSGC